MLRITEQEDFEARKREVEAGVAAWRESLARVPSEVKQEFNSKLMISLIYHDSALEGEVLSHSEIKAVIDTSIISDSSLIPSYDQISNVNATITVALELARKKKTRISVELIRQLYGILNPGAKEAGLVYRDGNPLHRLYYHKIAPPESVPAEMKKLDQWLSSSEYEALTPVEKASQAHWRLMGAFPWLEYSGPLSRILSLLILEQEGYPLPVIHSIDRQPYYEALRSPTTIAITKLYFEAVETSASSAMRVYEEAASYRGGGAAARAS